MAKASSLADTLGKHLECAVCLEQYNEPKVLPCLHTFCKQCLQGLLTQEGEVWKINCPSCRSFAEIPQGQVNLLPVNFFVNNLLAVVALHKDLESGNLECDVCESGDPPVNRCPTCLHFLCEFCSQAHRRGRATSSHDLMSLEEAKKVGSVSSSKPLFCKEHEGEVMKLFCETCSEAICRDCAIVNHRDHKYTFVRDAFPKYKESLMRLLSETKTKLSKLKEALDTATDMKTRIYYSAEQTTQEVITRFDELSALVDTRRTELISRINTIKEAKLGSLAVQQQEVQTALGCVQSSVEFTESAFENSSEVEILNMRGQMSNRLQELTLCHWQLEPCVDDVFNFREDNLAVELQHEISKFCDVTGEVAHAGMSTVTMEHGKEGVMYNTLCGQPVKFTITARKQNGAVTSEGGDIFNVQIDSNDAGLITSRTVLFCREKGAYCFSHTPEKEGPYSMSVMLNGRHIQGSPFSWFVEKWTLQPLSSGNKDVHIQLSEENLTASYLVYPKDSGFGALQCDARMTALTVGAIGTLLGVNTFAVTAGITFDATSHGTTFGTARSVFGNMPSTTSNTLLGSGTATATCMISSSVSVSRSSTGVGIGVPLFVSTAQPTSSDTSFLFGALPCTTSSSVNVPSYATGVGIGVRSSGSAEQPTSSDTSFLFGASPCTTATHSSGLSGTHAPTFSTSGFSFQTRPSTDAGPVSPSVGFSAGKHMWKVQVHGRAMDGFTGSFGIINITRKRNKKKTTLRNWWAWNSKLKQYPLLSGAQTSTESTITDCASGDIIELYLDHQDGTLKMYNPRTKQSDIWDGVKGEVLPVFRMTAHGDQISLKLQ